MDAVDFEMDDQLKAQIDQARRNGMALDETEPRAVKAWYEVTSQRVFLELKNGVVVGFPSQLLEGLESATPEQLSEVEISPAGYGLHWESLDADFAVPQLVAGIFGTKAWMKELGRVGGRSTSEAKTQASRENGKLGGRPRKSKTSVKPVS